MIALWTGLFCTYYRYFACMVLLFSLSATRTLAFSRTSMKRRTVLSLLSRSDRPSLHHQPQTTSSLFATTTPSSTTDNGLSLANYPNLPIQTIAAPMVAASDYAARCLYRQHGVDLAFTQMLHARNLVHDASFVTNHVDFYEYTSRQEEERLVLSSSQENLLAGLDHSRFDQRPELEAFCKGPLVVQLAGDDVDTILEAANLVLERTNGRVDGIDLNLGTYDKKNKGK